MLIKLSFSTLWAAVWDGLGGHRLLLPWGLGPTALELPACLPASEGWSERTAHLGDSRSGVAARVPPLAVSNLRLAAEQLRLTCGWILFAGPTTTPAKATAVPGAIWDLRGRGTKGTLPRDVPGPPPALSCRPPQPSALSLVARSPPTRLVPGVRQTCMCIYVSVMPESCLCLAARGPQQGPVCPDSVPSVPPSFPLFKSLVLGGR